jgi:hypothetical protein
MDYEKLDYEYAIVKQLYDKYEKDNKQISNELDKVIIFFIRIIIKLLKKMSYDDKGILEFFKINMFNDNVQEYGHIKTEELLSSINSITDLIELTKNLNIREKMTFIKNFQRTNDMNCVMYQMLLDYKKNKTEFKQKEHYNDVNILHVEKIIKTIENLLDFKIEETDLCYDTEYNLGECNEKNKKLYKMVNEDTFKYENDYPKICTLWVPVVYLFNYQNLIKGDKDNRLNKLIKCFEPKKQDNTTMKNIIDKYPFIESLSDREKNFIEKKTSEYNADKLPFKFIVCSTNKLQSFYLKLRERKGKLSISYSSGHTMMMLLMADYIKNINLYYILIALIIWTVPYNHSINEILSGSKQYGIFDEYDYDKTTLENVNIMLEKAKLNILELKELE